jgi:methylated-DNA-[protein]-cysteine S-methyltransferase
MDTMKPLQSLRIDSPLGPITLAATARGLCGLWFDEQRHGPSAANIALWPHTPDAPVLQSAAQQVQGYFAGQRQRFDLPLDLTHGTAFQQAVWQALLHIDAGQTASYGELARQVNKPQAMRAVGAAVGRNPVSLIVPCHRIVGSQGQLTGYAGGLWRKEALLRLEGHLAN